jgi:type IV pilus assembly protein PilW
MTHLLHSVQPRRYARQAQRGFSLIELLVALVINLIIVIAAAYLYLGTSETKRAVEQQQSLNENGQYALDMIGREIVNAGFYPTVRTTGVARLTYQADPIATSNAPFKSGIFGCSAQSFNPTTKTCVNHASGAVTADTIVVNYFTNDAMGVDMGQRLDCNRSDVSGAAENLGRTTGANSNGATSGLIPTQALFVSNRYTLVTTTFAIEGQAISTLSLACVGNVNSIYQPAIVGIENLQFRYGVYTDATTLQPNRYYQSSEMAGLGSVLVNGLSKDAWERVVSVEICLVARGLQPTKQTTATGAVTPYVNCNGTSVTPGDRFTRKVYRKIYALRNNLTQTIVPAS